MRETEKKTETEKEGETDGGRGRERVFRRGQLT